MESHSSAGTLQANPAVPGTVEEASQQASGRLSHQQSHAQSTSESESNEFHGADQRGGPTPRGQQDKADGFVTKARRLHIKRRIGERDSARRASKDKQAGTKARLKEEIGSLTERKVALEDQLRQATQATAILQRQAACIHNKWRDAEADVAVLQHQNASLRALQEAGIRPEAGTGEAAPSSEPLPNLLHDEQDSSGD